MVDTIFPPHLTTNSVAFGLGTPDFHLQIIWACGNETRARQDKREHSCN